MKPDIDIDSLRTEHESDEQWELRRSFMIEHKDKFNEDELVTLAQLFTNIEFLGCRYITTVMEDMVRMGRKIIADKKENGSFGWCENYPITVPSLDFKWRSMDVRCISHGVCALNEKLKANVCYFNITTDKTSTPARGPNKNISKKKTATASAGDTNIPANNDNKEKSQTKKEKKRIIKTNKTLENVPCETAKYTGFDYNLLNVKHVNRCLYKAKSANDNLKFDITPEIDVKNEKFEHSLHPLLDEFSYFSITKADGTSINTRLVTTLINHINVLLNNMEITSQVVHFEFFNHFKELIFSLKDLHVDKFIVSYEFDINDIKYTVKSYELVKAALLIPQNVEYDTKNILQWLKYMNRHMNVKLLSWEIFDEFVYADLNYIYLRIPKSDAVALNRYHYKLNYVDVKLKLKLYPKSKKSFVKLETMRESEPIENVKKPKYDKDMIKLILNTENLTLTEGEYRTKSSASKDMSDGFVVSESNKEINGELFEKAVLFMSEGNFEINPFVVLETENSRKNLNIAEWRHVYLDEHFRDTFVVSMPSCDALKLKNKQVRLRYRSVKVKVRFPNDSVEK